MFTNRHYEKVAETIAREFSYESRDEEAFERMMKAFEVMFIRDNQSFNPAEFRKAAGIVRTGKFGMALV